MQSSLQLRRNLLFGGYSAEYNISEECTLNSEERQKFAWALLHEILPKDAAAGRNLRNIKGRDKLNLIDEAIVISDLPTADELFYVSGTAREPLEDSIEQDEEVDEKYFFYSINTQFLAFVGSNNIDQSIVIKKSGPVPSTLEGSNYHFVESANIGTLRLGIDLFSAHIFGFLGFTPEVTQTVLLELNGSELLFRISADRLKKKDEIPLQTDNFLDRLSKVFSDFFQFDLKADYISRLI